MGVSLDSERRSEIDAIKSIAILGVIIGHLPLTDSSVGYVETLQFLLSSWAALAFFWASGFLTKSTLKKRTLSWREIAINKAKRLLIPFVLLCFVNSVILFLLSKAGMVEAEQLPWNNQAHGIHFFVRLIP
ncbi:MAG: acyltransferase family protein, partial [Pseudomonadota bacterium]